MNVVEAATQSDIGKRSRMQDAMVHARDLYGTNYIGVFDGHMDEGALFANAAARLTYQYATEKPFRSALRNASRIKDLFKNLHQVYEGYEETQVGGTTATVAVVGNGYLGVPYIGDSEAAYFSDDGNVTYLTQPHNTSNISEVKSITNKGIGLWKQEGNIYFTDMRDKRSGIIALSRSIGDYNFSFLNRESEVVSTRINSPGFLVVGSDGTWSSHREVDEIVHATKKVGLQAMADLLIEAGVTRTRDNASVIVARVE